LSAILRFHYGKPAAGGRDAAEGGISEGTRYLRQKPPVRFAHRPPPAQVYVHLEVRLRPFLCTYTCGLCLWCPLPRVYVHLEVRLWPFSCTYTSGLEGTRPPPAPLQ